MRPQQVIGAIGVSLIVGTAVVVAVAGDSPGGFSPCSSPSATSAMVGPQPPLDVTAYRWVEVAGIERVGDPEDGVVTVRLDDPRSLRPVRVTPPAEATVSTALRGTIGGRGPLLLGLSEGGAIGVAVDLNGKGGVRVLGPCGAEATTRLERAGREAGTTAEGALRAAISDPGPSATPYASKSPATRRLDLLDLTIPPEAFAGLRTLTVRLDLPARPAGFSARLCGRLPEAWVQCAPLTSQGTYEVWHRGEGLSLWLDGGGDRRTYGQLVAFTPEQLARGSVTLRLVDGLPLSQLTLRAVTGGPVLQVVD